MGAGFDCTDDKRQRNCPRPSGLLRSAMSGFERPVPICSSFPVRCRVLKPSLKTLEAVIDELMRPRLLNVVNWRHAVHRCRDDFVTRLELQGQRAALEARLHRVPAAKPQTGLMRRLPCVSQFSFPRSGVSLGARSAKGSDPLIHFDSRRCVRGRPVYTATLRDAR